MTEKRSVIPKAPCIRMLSNAGAKRVSANAADEFSQLLTDKAIAIAEQAMRISHHSKRKTIQYEDIKLAARK